MKAKWVVEDAFSEDMMPLFEAMKKLNIEYRVTDRHKLLLNNNDYFNDDDCVIFYGCIDSAKAYRKSSKQIPGVYFNENAYRCRNYYPVFGDYLLNSNYMMIPYGELLRQKELLYKCFGQDRTIFIRPDSGDKVFTGKLIYKEHFDKDVNMLGFYDVYPEEICVVSEPINIVAEWRFVVADSKVVAGSLYKENNIVGSSATYPVEAYNLASLLCKMYYPDDAWVIDICKTKSGEFKLLEIGCFSCCGLYACDRESVVKAVSEVALSEWKSFQATTW